MIFTASTFQPFCLASSSEGNLSSPFCQSDPLLFCSSHNCVPFSFIRRIFLHIILLPFGSWQFSGSHSSFQSIVLQSSFQAESLFGYLKNYTHLRVIRLIQAATKSAAEEQSPMSRHPFFQKKSRTPDGKLHGVSPAAILPSTSATRLSPWDPWLSVPRLLVVWHCRSLVEDLTA